MKRYKVTMVAIAILLSLGFVNVITKAETSDSTLLYEFEDKEIYANDVYKTTLETHKLNMAVDFIQKHFTQNFDISEERQKAIDERVESFKSFALENDAPGISEQEKIETALNNNGFSSIEQLIDYERRNEIEMLLANEAIAANFDQYVKETNPFFLRGISYINTEGKEQNDKDIENIKEMENNLKTMTIDEALEHYSHEANFFSGNGFERIYDDNSINNTDIPLPYILPTLNENGISSYFPRENDGSFYFVTYLKEGEVLDNYNQYLHEPMSEYINRYKKDILLTYIDENDVTFSDPSLMELVVAYLKLDKDN